MYPIDYLLLVVPTVAFVAAVVALIVRPPGAERRLTWRRFLLAGIALGIGMTSFSFAAYLVQKM